MAAASVFGTLALLAAGSSLPRCWKRLAVVLGVRSRLPWRGRDSPFRPRSERRHRGVLPGPPGPPRSCVRFVLHGVVRKVRALAPVARNRSRRPPAAS